MLALCGEGILCRVHSFVHSGSWFVVKSVLNGFDLASRIKSGAGGHNKKPPF